MVVSNNVAQDGRQERYEMPQNTANPEHDSSPRSASAVGNPSLFLAYATFTLDRPSRGDQREREIEDEESFILRTLRQTLEATDDPEISHSTGEHRVTTESAKFRNCTLSIAGTSVATQSRWRMLRGSDLDLGECKLGCLRPRPRPQKVQRVQE
jgi:hypothetical protein